MSQPPPPCPMCGHARKSKRRGPGDYFCQVHGLYDDEPNEGGDFSADPSRRMQRQEARAQKHRNRYQDRFR